MAKAKTKETTPKKKTRGQGEGNIYQMKNGTWSARLTVGYDENGKQKRKAFYGKTRKEVQEKLTAALNDVNQDTYIEPSTMTLNQWLDIWLLEYCKPSMKSRSYERRHCTVKVHIRPAFGQYKLKDIRNDMVQKFVNDLNNKGLAYNTVKSTHATLNTALNQAIENGLIKNNAASKIRLPKHDKKELHVLSIEEQERFISIAKNKNYGEIFILALATGLRIGEILALQWDDINFDDGTLRVNKTQYQVKDPDQPEKKWCTEVVPPKTKSSNRIIPLLPEVIEMLEKHKKTQAEQGFQCNNRLFCTPNNTPIQHCSIRYHFKQIRDQAEINKSIHIHSLRHTFATRGLENGIELKVMQELLGHSSIQMTADTYSHVLPDKKKDSIMKLSDTIKL